MKLDNTIEYCGSGIRVIKNIKTLPNGPILEKGQSVHYSLFLEMYRTHTSKMIHTDHYISSWGGDTQFFPSSNLNKSLLQSEKNTFTHPHLTTIIFDLSRINSLFYIPVIRISYIISVGLFAFLWEFTTNSPPDTKSANIPLNGCKQLQARVTDVLSMHY